MTTPPTLAYLSARRITKKKQCRDYLKNVPSLLTPKLRADMYTRLLQIDKKFNSYMPKEANVELEAANLKKDLVSCQHDEIFRHVNDIEKLKKMKCYGPELRQSMIMKNYTTFFTMTDRTEDEWRVFFKYARGNDSGKIKQLVEEQPVIAVCCDQAYLNLIENFTVDMCVQFVKRLSFIFPNDSAYLRIRETINKTAESQLQAIVGNLSHMTINRSKAYPRLYDNLKSEECIYAWIKHGIKEYEQQGELSSVPIEFRCDRVLIEVVRLGNTKIFEFWKDKSEELIMACLDICPRLLERVPDKQQTTKMRDLVLSKSMENFRFVAYRLHTIDICWDAILFRMSFVRYTAPAKRSPDMLRYIIYQMCDKPPPVTQKDDKENDDDDDDGGFCKWIKKYVLEPSLDLQWYLVVKALDKKTLAAEQLVCWFSSAYKPPVLEYIANHCSEQVVEKCFPSISASLSIDKIESLVLKSPQFIKYCRNIPVTEEMSIRALNLSTYYFADFCLKTPKTFEIACSKDWCNLYCVNSGDQIKMVDMLFTCPNLAQYAHRFSKLVIEKYPKLVNFRTCSILFSGVDTIPSSTSSSPEEDNKSKIIQQLLTLLKNNKFWLLYKCFSLACYSNSERKELEEENWHENVTALGEIDTFDINAINLILSFTKNENNPSDDSLPPIPGFGYFNGAYPDVYESDSDSDTDSDSNSESDLIILSRYFDSDSD